MPNLPTHFRLALHTLRRIGDEDIEAHIGSYLLGSVTPDIRARTKWKRSHTHFATLSVERVGVGADGLFHANPHLAEAIKSSPATRAFLAGYLTHLAADETWITQVYRPNFANRDLFEDEIHANLIDRALQLRMDTDAGDDEPAMNDILNMLDSSEDPVKVGFIDDDTLADWRKWVVDFCNRPFSWERLYFLMNRMYRDNDEAKRAVSAFLEDAPGNLNTAMRRMPKQAVSDFREQAVSAAASQIVERL